MSKFMATSAVGDITVEQGMRKETVNTTSNNWINYKGDSQREGVATAWQEI
jgi:hypothetical protein